MSETKQEAPARIYLQTGCDPEECVELNCPSWDHEGVTWCQHEIHEGDTAYVRADIADALRAVLRDAPSPDDRFPRGFDPTAPEVFLRIYREWLIRAAAITKATRGEG